MKQPAGRFVGAAVTFLVGAGVQHFHTIGVPVAWTAVASVVELPLLPFGDETQEKRLPKSLGTPTPKNQRMGHPHP